MLKEFILFLIHELSISKLIGFLFSVVGEPLVGERLEDHIGVVLLNSGGGRGERGDHLFITK